MPGNHFERLSFVRRSDISQLDKRYPPLVSYPIWPCHPEVAAAAQESSRDCRLLKVGGGHQSRMGMRMWRESLTARVITCHSRWKASVYLYWMLFLSAVQTKTDIHPTHFFYNFPVNSTAMP